jgi:hypothetical protein
MEHQTTIIDLRGSGRASSEADFGVLTDPSGRRRRGLRQAGRTVAVLFALWLAALALAGLGLLPGAGIPLASRTTADGAPPPLGERSPLVAAGDARPALTHVATATVSPIAEPAPGAPRATGLARRRAAARERKIARERRVVTVRPVPVATVPAATAPASAPPAATPVAHRPATPPGQAEPAPGHSGTAPGQTRPAKTSAPTATPTPVHGKSGTAPGRSGR